MSDDIQDIVLPGVEINYDAQFTKQPERQKEKTIEDENQIFIAVKDSPKSVGGMESIIKKLYYPG